jgi:3,4-dihydroxy 2-butanone 4-phosphate synthase/GTP cyclohydrolase II
MEEVLEIFARGGFVLVAESDSPDATGLLVAAAEQVGASSVAFMRRHTTGIICAAMSEDRLAELRLPLMVPSTDGVSGVRFTVSVDLASAAGAGVSAVDRSATLRALANLDSTGLAFRRPGHVFPIETRDGGVLAYPGCNEAAIDLCRLSGVSPVAALAPVTNDDGALASWSELLHLSRLHHIPIVTVQDVIEQRARTEPLLVRVEISTMLTSHGEFLMYSYSERLGGLTQIALTHGAVVGSTGALVRVHSECVTGDAMRSRRCDCGEQLRLSMDLIAEAGCGVLIYLKGHEGRGIGLEAKMRAYRLQDSGLDTIDANLALGLPADSRDYGVAAHILRDLDIRSPILLTNSPAKVDGLARYGVTPSGVLPLRTQPNPDNYAYLSTKAARLRHSLAL